MGGGPATIDIWDLKPGAPTGGPFQPIGTSGNEQICEHLPLMAKQMHHLAIVRSMSTREADHNRGRYYMHTGYVPNPTIEHPSYGSVISHMLAEQTKQLKLEIPPFVAVGGGSVGPGLSGHDLRAVRRRIPTATCANLKMGIDADRLDQRMQMLASLEKNFVKQDRGQSAVDHANILEKTVALMTSKQMDAFKVDQESRSRARAVRQDRLRPRLPDGPPAGRAGRAVRRSRPGRLGHARQQLHARSPNTKLPELDKAMSALVADLRRARPAGRHGHHLDGRVRPHAADQRQRRPRPLGPQLERRARRRRHEGRHRRRQHQRRRHRRRQRALHVRRT